MKYKIFGCRVNKYFLNKWMKVYKTHLDNEIIISTCVVTEKAKKKCLKEILKCIIQYDKVYITGCFAIEKGMLLSRESFFEQYFELKDYQNKIELLDQFPKIIGNEYSKNDISDEVYTKKFILIQNGCDNHCTFCLSVIKRGNSYSRPIEDIIDEIKYYEKSGAKEVVLTGINMAAYGVSNTRKPHESKFADLLETILFQTKINRIRISSIGPEYLNDKLYNFLENSRIMPYFHLSIQSFSDTILKKMNRNYDYNKLIEILNRLNKLNRGDGLKICIGADLIVGFPGEKQQDFDITYNSVKQFGLSKLHVFPFSPHNQKNIIPAGKFIDQIDIKQKKDREKSLINLGNELRNQFIEKNKGIRCEILIEEKKDGKRYGWTPNYIQKGIEGNYKKGDLVEVVI